MAEWDESADSNWIKKMPKSSNASSSDSSGYSKGTSYSRGNDSYGSNSYSSKRDATSYSRNDTNSYSSRNNSNSYSSRNDSFSGDSSSGYGSRGGGYNSRGRGGGRFQSDGFRSQNGDSWNCSSCNFSNYANRTSCYKCSNPKEEGGGDTGRKWGSSDDSSWKKPSGGDSRNTGYSNGRDKYDNRNSSSKDSWGRKDKSTVPLKDDGLIDWDDLSKNEAKYEAERWVHLPELIKDLYVEHPGVTAMTPEAVKQFRKDSFGMKVKCESKDKVIPNPVQTFDQAFSSYPLIISEIKRQGFTTPSPIQCQAWPILMKGYDMIGTSQTGSGKTLAFLLPALLHIVAQPTPRRERIGPTCLVLAPTRELAQQIEREVTKFKYENIKCVCCYGQGDKRTQIQKLNAKSEIVIATPGRLNDFVEQGIVDLSGVSYLVLDEADRMLDMGFEPQVRKIVIDIRPDRQTIMTSATWPNEVRKFADKLVKEPIHIIVGSLDLQAVHTITQHVIVCEVTEKEEKLIDFLRGMKPEDKAIVFIGQKVIVDYLSVKLLEMGIFVESMHGGRDQSDRENSLHQLKTGRSKVLLATDVAARGLDINDITHVLNYDCPRDMEEYVHRVGRTGRAGRLGQSLTLMCRDDWKVSGKLIDILNKSRQEIPTELVRMKERWDRVKDERGERSGRNSRYGGGNRNDWYNS